MQFDVPDLSDVVYLEQATSALYLEKPAEVDRYAEAMQELSGLAETVPATKRALRQILADM